MREVREWPTTLKSGSVELQKLSRDDCNSLEIVKDLTAWRSEHSSSFLSRFVPTQTRTSVWLTKTFVADPRNALYLIHENGKRTGHIGVRYASPQSIEIDNVLKGVQSGSKQTMSLALDLIVSQLIKSNEEIIIFLRVLSNNFRARRLYEKAGFETVDEVRLRQVFTGTESRLEPCAASVSNVNETLLTMKLHPRLRESRDTEM